MPDRERARPGRLGPGRSVGEGYDESQRDQILMATQDAPSDGLLQTSIVPDLEEDQEETDDIESFGAEMPDIRADR